MREPPATVASPPKPDTTASTSDPGAAPGAGSAGRGRVVPAPGPTRQWDPSIRAGKVAEGVARFEASRVLPGTATLLSRIREIVMLGSNASYAADPAGGSVRKLATAMARDMVARMGTSWSMWLLDLAHGTWEDPDGMAYLSWVPLTDDDVRKLATAVGVTFGEGEVHWVLLDIEPGIVFTEPGAATTGAATTAAPGAHVGGATPAQRERATRMVAGLTTAWGPGGAAVPTFHARFSERTGWHVRIAVGGRETEVPLREGDSEQDLHTRVEIAVARVRAGAEPPGPEHPDPPWWAEPDPALAGLPEGANAAALPATVLYAADESKTHPTLMANALYDFRMQVQWQFAGPLGFAEAMVAGYRWELLAASSDDWFRLSGEKPPTPPTPGEMPPTPPIPGEKPPTPPTPAAPRVEDAPLGSGTGISKSDDALAPARMEARKAEVDIANTRQEDDVLASAGEHVAAVFRSDKALVLSIFSDVLDRRDPSHRRITIPRPGYYVIRCISTSRRSKDPAKDFIREPSVAVIPVKVEDAAATATASALADRDKAGGRSTYARFAADQQSLVKLRDDAKALATRLAADPGLRARLADAPVPTAGALPDPEIIVLNEAEDRRVTVEELARDLDKQIDDMNKHAKIVDKWHTELQGEADFPVSATLVLSDSGEEIPLQLMIGQEKGWSDAAPHWIVYDITSSETREIYKGATAVPAQLGGHAIALKAALAEFAGKNRYGYGTIAFAWPDHFAGVQIRTADLPPSLPSEPDKEQREHNRHVAYVEIAALLIPIGKLAKLKTLVEAAEAFTAVMGGVHAVGELRRRARTGHLREPGTLLELAQVAGGALRLARGAHWVIDTAGLVRAARVVGRSLDLLTKLEGALQIVSIPVSVREQLLAIDEMKGASAEHKAALAIFIFGRAVRDGTVSVRALRPEQEPHFYDDTHEVQPPAPEREHEAAPPERTPPPRPAGRAAGHALPELVDEMSLTHRVAEVLRRPVRPLEQFTHVYDDVAAYEAEFARRFPGRRAPGGGYFDPNTGELHVSPHGNALTVLHEAIHKVAEDSSPFAKQLVGAYLNEGITEAITRSRCGPRTGVHAYDRNVEVVDRLAAVLGRDVVENLILHGDYPRFRAAVRARLGSEQATVTFMGMLLQVGPQEHDSPALGAALALLEGHRRGAGPVAPVGRGTGPGRGPERDPEASPAERETRTGTETGSTPDRTATATDPAAETAGGTAAEPSGTTAAEPSPARATEPGGAAVGSAEGPTGTAVTTPTTAHPTPTTAPATTEPAGTAARTQADVVAHPATTPTTAQARPAPSRGPLSAELATGRLALDALLTTRPRLGTRLDAAVAALEALPGGLNEADRAAVRELFRPTMPEGGMGVKRFTDQLEVLERALAVAGQRDPHDEGFAQRRRAQLLREGRLVLDAYELGTTQERAGRATRPTALLDDEMSALRRALTEAPATGAGRVADHLAVERLGAEVNRAAEVLRSHGESLWAVERTGDEPAARAALDRVRSQVGNANRDMIDALGRGDRVAAEAAAARLDGKALLDATQVGAPVVTASGRLDQPLARQLPGLGLEHYVRSPAEIGRLRTTPPGLGERLRRLVATWQRAHLVGPGFGDELFAGIMLAPPEFNLETQNKGIEELLRLAQDHGYRPDVKIRATGTRHALPLEGGGVEYVEILGGVRYEIDWQGRTLVVEYAIDVPGGTARIVHSDIDALTVEGLQVPGRPAPGRGRSGSAGRASGRRG